MNLLYALTYYGIGTCPLIWNDDGEKAEEIRRFVDIPWSEQIVAIIQVGHYATNEIASMPHQIDELFSMF